MESIKISRKSLTSLAESLDAQRITGNVYTYDNDLYYLSNLDNSFKDCDKVASDLIESNHEATHAYINRLAYSVGMYGRTAQLDKVEFLSEDGEVLKTAYVYFC